MSTVDPAARTAARLFDRIVCGVDDTPESLEALRQAERLAAPDGLVVALSVLNLAQAAQAGWAAGVAADNLAYEAREALDRAGRTAPQADLRLLEGSPVPALLGACSKEQATLAVVGSQATGARSESPSAPWRRA